MMPSALQAIDLSFSRSDRVLFKNLSFELAAGHILQVEGPNGCGKTTLLRTLSSLLTPDSGEIHWQGQRIDKNRDEFLATIIFIGHAPALKDDLNPLENLNFLGNLQGCHEEVSPQEALSKLSLGDYGDIPVRALSAGQRRRVALARLFITKAKLWILDEPFTSLDTQGQRLLESLLVTHINKDGMLIITSHQPLSLENVSVTSLDLGHG